MCGIIGCVTERPVDPAAFDRARDLMRHRGPDDGGSLHAGPVHLGARRLAILDLSPAGHQPMTSEDGALAVVFNGEIYNFPELRAELEAGHGCRFRSRADTEVLLHGHRAWGWQGLLRRIDGMFAIALWDAAQRTLHLARDRVGKKPLYWCRGAEGVYFASTLAALLGLLPRRPRLEARALDAYLVYQAVPAPLTVYAGVEQLPPAHEARFRPEGGEPVAAPYWDVTYRDKLRLSEGEALEEVERLLAAAVRRRLLADVPVGCFLSGGVDSGLVTALMARESAGPVEAVTLGFEEPAYDERLFARAAARRVGVRLHEEVLSPAALQEMPAVLAAYGQPLADVSALPTYCVARAARRHVTVVLNGDGGDELFGGYARPVVARAAELYRRGVPEPLRRLAARWDAAGRLRGRAALLVRAGRGAASDAFVYDRGLRAERARAYTGAFRAALEGFDPDGLYRRVWQVADGRDDVDRALYGDFKTYLPDQLLVKMDVATMAHSLEARSPLLDTALVEFAARLPTELRLRAWRTKHLLKRLAARHLPPEIVYRRKRGFVMPAGEWLLRVPEQVRASLGPGARVREYLESGWVDRLVAGHLGDPAARWRVAGMGGADAGPDGGRRRTGRGGRPETGTDLGGMLWTVWALELWLRLEDGSLRAGDPLDAVLEGGGRPPLAEGVHLGATGHGAGAGDGAGAGAATGAGSGAGSGAGAGAGSGAGPETGAGTATGAGAGAGAGAATGAGAGAATGAGAGAGAGAGVASGGEPGAASLPGTAAAAAAAEVAAAATAPHGGDPTAAPTGHLRVLAVGMGWFPQQPGGLNRVYHQLCRHLPSAGVAVDGLVEEMEGAEGGDGWSVRGMEPGASGTGRATRLLGRRRCLRQALSAAGVDLVASHFAPSFWPGLRALGGLPLVVHFHGPWAQELVAEGAGAAKATAARAVELAVYRRAARFIVLSRAFGAILERDYGIPGERIRLVPGGVEAERFALSLTRREARERLGWPADRPVLLVVRRLVRRMGIEDLLQAVADVRRSLPELWLAVVGDGALRTELEARAADLGLADSAVFTGRLPDDLLPVAYRAADLSVVPSVALEGFGLILAESLAAGTPALGTPVGGIPEVLEPLSPSLVAPGTGSGALAEALGALLRGETALPSEEACRTYAQTRFDWAAVARQVRAVYQEAVDG